MCEHTISSLAGAGEKTNVMFFLPYFIFSLRLYPCVACFTLLFLSLSFFFLLLVCVHLCIEAFIPSLFVVSCLNIREKSIKGIFWRKFNPRSNTPWHRVRPPPSRSSFATASLCSFSNPRKKLHDNNTLQSMPPPRNHHQKATNNAQNSTKRQ